jgi:2-hydroxy-6-oxonona-2,4-dienedioate hydrolase
MISSFLDASTASIPLLHRTGAHTERPALVLVHGLFGRLSNFESCLPFLDPEFEVWVPELPIYATYMDFHRVADLAIWLGEWLEQMGIEKAILAGNSLGGQICLEMAHRAPERCSGLLLIGSSGLYEAEFGGGLPRRFDREYIRQKTSEVFYQRPVSEPMIDEINDILANRTLLFRLIQLARSARRDSVRTFLPNIAVPTAVIWGEQDQITPLQVAYEFAEQLPHAYVEVIPECGHVPMLEQPQAFATAVNTYLSRFKTNENH